MSYKHLSLEERHYIKLSTEREQRTKISARIWTEQRALSHESWLVTLVKKATGTSKHKGAARSVMHAKQSRLK